MVICIYDYISLFSFVCEYAFHIPHDPFVFSA